MARNTMGSNIRLGIFVFAGVLFLVVMLYLVGRQENLFSSTFELKARFPNVQGLQSGNNVRYSGIKIGTVKSVDIINDTTIEVVMRIEQKMQPYLHRNIVASVGTEGFIGNKVLNLSPGRGTAAAVEPGFIVASKRSVDTDDMIETLEQTNRDVGVAAAHLRETIQKFNTSTALWQLLNDQALPDNISASAVNIRSATVKTREMMSSLEQIVAGIREGRGSLGAIITDTSLATELDSAIFRIKMVGDQAQSLALGLRNAVDQLNQEIHNGKGTVHALLKDTAIAQSFTQSLQNIENGTAAFNENMEALKHNILFRGYFRKLERQKSRN